MQQWSRSDQEARRELEKNRPFIIPLLHICKIFCTFAGDLHLI